MRVKVRRGNQGYRCRDLKVADFDLAASRIGIGGSETRISLSLFGPDLTTYSTGREHSVREVVSIDLTDDQAHELKVILDRLLAAPFPGEVANG